MDGYHDNTAGSVAGDGVPPESNQPAASAQTLRLSALDHLTTGLRDAGHEATAMSWAHVAQYTLSAVQHASASSARADGLLTRRLALNDDLYHAFSARKRGQPWTIFDGPTVLLAIDDLIAAEQRQPRPEA